MNLKKILSTVLLTTSLAANSFSQSEKYSLFLGSSYMVPKKEIRQDFNLLKGLEIGLEKPINKNSSMGVFYYSGYKWGHQQSEIRTLEPKINSDGLSIFYNHKIKTSSKISPFYGAGIGYERFKLKVNEGEGRIIEKTGGETLNFGIGAEINLNKRKNKELYLALEKEFFIPNTKTEQKYSNIKFNIGINFKRFPKQR